MKKALLLTAILAVCLTATGCFYAAIKMPQPAVAYYGPTSTTASKMGEASWTNILGIIATGDASIDAAMKKAGISKVHHIDQSVTNILGLFSTYTTVVYGE